MNLFRLYVKPVGSRRYRVLWSRKTLFRISDRFLVHALETQMIVTSVRDYRPGVIINPTKVIKQLIEARKVAA